MSNPEKEQFNPEPTGEQYEKKEEAPKAPKVQEAIDKYKEYEEIVQDIEKRRQEVAELHRLIHLQEQYKYSAPERVIRIKTREIRKLQDKGDELWKSIPDVFSDASNLGELYNIINDVGGQMYSENAKRISAEETIRNIEDLRKDLKTKERKEFFLKTLKMDNKTKESIFFHFLSRSGGLRSKVRELIEQEIMEKTVDSAEIPKTGKGTEGAETAEREQ